MTGRSTNSASVRGACISTTGDGTGSRRLYGKAGVAWEASVVDTGRLFPARSAALALTRYELPNRRRGSVPGDASNATDNGRSGREGLLLSLAVKPTWFGSGFGLVSIAMPGRGAERL